MATTNIKSVTKKKNKLIRCFCGNKFRPKRRKQMFCSAVCEKVYSPASLRDSLVRPNRTNIPWTIVFDPDDTGYPVGSILYDVDLTLQYGSFNLGTVLTRMGKICVVIRPDEENCRQELIDISRVVYQDLVISNASIIKDFLKNDKNTTRYSSQEGVWSPALA